MSLRCIGLALVMVLLSQPRWAHAQGATQEATQSSTAPATQPTTHFVIDATTVLSAKPATQEATTQTGPRQEIEGKALALLRRMQTAYKKLNSLAVGGEVLGHYNIAGEITDERGKFMAMYLEPNLFRHHAHGDVQMGSTGEKIFVFSPERKKFVAVDAPKGDFLPGKIPAPAGELIHKENPSLAMALSKDPMAELLEERLKQNPNVLIRRLEDVKVAHLRYPTVSMVADGEPLLTFSLDPETFLLRQIKMNLKPDMIKRGVKDVREAELTVTYDVIEKNPPMTPEDFVWSPPVGIRDANNPNAGVEENWPAFELAGRLAPDFTLNDLTVKPVSLTDQAGHVLVIDFWATWCAPCIEALPHLDQIQKDFADRGVKVYCINWNEELDKVEAFVGKKKFSFSILLDSDGKVAELYKLVAPPQTMVIGKDGVIRKVFIGPDTHEMVRAEIEAALGAP